MSVHAGAAIETRFRTMPSPVGELLISAVRGEEAGGEGLSGIWFEMRRHPPVGLAEWREDDGSWPVLTAAVAQLAEYFAGTRRTFDLRLAPHGTAFQRRVWELLRAIPYGTTTTYGELARTLGDPHATRAVGAANGRNPISIVVPCHRVVGAAGALTGFGGGIERKQWLLAHEARVAGTAGLQLTMM